MYIQKSKRTGYEMRAVERIKASSERFQPHRKANADFQPHI